MKSHLFHFIISESFNRKISYLKKEMKIKRNSSLLNYMFHKILRNMDILKKIIGDHYSKYAHIDETDSIRCNKYIYLYEENYKIIKKWHYKYNEYGMAAIIRDIIIFFYEGIVKYGVKKFMDMICKRLNREKIVKELKRQMQQLFSSISKKRFLFTMIIENLPKYIL